MNTRLPRGASRLLLTALVLLAALPAASSAGAQTVWEGMERPEGLRLELHHPELATDRFGGLSTVAFFGGRVVTSPGFALVGDLPFAYADDDVFAESELAIGAPYLGFELLRPGFVVEGGLRIPIASENIAASFGNAAEAVDRPWAFASSLLPVTLAGVWGGTSAGGFVHRIRVGPELLVPTEGGDVELLLDYAGLIGYEGAGFGVEGGVVGWGILTEDLGDLGARTVHELGIQAYHRSADGGRIGLLLRIPLDDDASGVQDFTLGLTASLAM